MAARALDWLSIPIALVIGVGMFLYFAKKSRPTLIAAVAIPSSLIATFAAMAYMGFTLNVITLLALTLAVGIVIDDAIVVLENIYVKIERGRRPLEAALEGSKEIFFAVVSTTVALAAVFLPIVFLQGLTGRLFREFGAVVRGDAQTVRDEQIER